MDDRREIIEIDLSSVQTIEELHRTLAAALGFPGFYGRNWDAFWDAITGLVEMPRRLRLSGWASLEDRLPSDALKMRECLAEMAVQFPELSATIEYVGPELRCPEETSRRHG